MTDSKSGRSDGGPQSPKMGPMDGEGPAGEDRTAKLIGEGLLQRGELFRQAATELPDLVVDLINAVEQCLRKGGKLMFCGNGGSAADAQHLAAEYVVRFRRNRPGWAALALTTDTSVLTAAGNDLGFQQVFARQVQALGRPEDLLILHSTSGNSTNLLEAADAARAGGIVTAALLAGSGGELRGRVDLAVVMPTDDTAMAQELHLAVGHLVCQEVEHRLSEGPWE
ncbi:MAG: SIS domain-containing protein [Gemmatimonadota bacterium]